MEIEYTSLVGKIRYVGIVFIFNKEQNVIYHFSTKKGEGKSIGVFKITKWNVEPQTV